MDEVAEFQSDGVYDLSTSPIYPTVTGDEKPAVVGIEMVSAAKGVGPQPIVAFVEIDRHNVREVVHAGAGSVCVIDAMTLADDL